MATRKRSNAKSPRGVSPFTWFTTGLLIGLGGAVFLFVQGVIPGPAVTEPGPRQSSNANEPELLADEPEASRDDEYDFFTVLPEMEVVVPERELVDRAEPADPNVSQRGAEQEQFILQAGSFRSAQDADQMKARLALLGSVASVQTVTVNNETWHRVRLGPVTGAREADQLRRRLLNDGIDVMVLKDNG